MTLFSAIRNKKDYVVDFMLDNFHDLDVNLVYKNRTPLLLAIEVGDNNIVKRLLSHPDIDINLSCDKGHCHSNPAQFAITERNVKRLNY